MEKISQENKKEPCSEPGCLCTLLGIVGFIVKQLWREIKAEKEDAINQAADDYPPKSKMKMDHLQKQGRN